MAGCCAIEPRLRGAEILGHRVGLRPCRPEVRLESEPLGPFKSVLWHNYGHGGAGISMSWGCAAEITAAIAVNRHRSRADEPGWGGQASRFQIRIVHHHDCVIGPQDTLLLMKFAIAIPQFYADGKFNPAGFRAYFARAEELGFDSAWTQEAVLGPGPQLSPIEAMTYAAACTERMRLGCVVFVSTLHSPVHLAKSVSTLDQLSRGRIEIGVGTGGKGRPFAAFGVDPGHTSRGSPRESR